MTVRVLFHVQHLLGIGHLTRAAALARAFAEDGMQVTVASGGEPVRGVDFGRATLVQLPPARVADRRFKELLDERGAPVDDEWRARRRERLLALHGAADPDVVLTELFPFGRRQLRFELLPLLDRCAAGRARAGRPRVVCSLRDILVGSPKPERTRETLDLVRRYYDLVLVHGDPRFVSLDATFPHAARIADRIAYTGYVVNRPRDGSAGSPPAASAAPAPAPGRPPPAARAAAAGVPVAEEEAGGRPARPARASPRPPAADADPRAAEPDETRGPGRTGEGGGTPRDGAGEAIVSAGGGAVGGRLLEAALAARPRTRLADARWRLLAGANLSEDEFRSLAARAPEGVAVERFRPDFAGLLRRARLSVSQGGYNTVMEVLDAGLPAVVVPYAGGLETEQTLRANLLAARGLVEVVGEDDLDGASLAAAVERALTRPPHAGLAGIDTGGAAAAVRRLRALGR